MNKETNADRLLEDLLLYGTFWAKKTDRLRLSDNGRTILSQGTPIGVFVSEYDDRSDCYQDFLVLTMQDFKSQPTWKKHKKDLIKAAHHQRLRVIFVPAMDIGFGVPASLISTEFMRANDICDLLIKVAGNSSEPDIKTSCCCIENGNMMAYTYNQYNKDDEIDHAEKILTDYMYVVHGPECKRTFYTLLEPCYHCLEAMLDIGGDDIVYGYPHKDKWNTADYCELINDICAGTRRTIFGNRLYYEKLSYDKIDKFYNKTKRSAK